MVISRILLFHYLYTNLNRLCYTSTLCKGEWLFAPTQSATFSIQIGITSGELSGIAKQKFGLKP